MKTLTEFIAEGLLKGQQKTLASGEKDIDAVKNIPRLKDFYTNPGGIAVWWYCPGFIQNYLKYIKCIKGMA